MICLYDPKSYWNRRQDPNSSGGKEKDAILRNIAFIKQEIASHHSILDFGPGVGRLLEAYDPEHKIYAVDLSSQYKGRLCAKALSLGLDLSFVLLNDVALDLPIPCVDCAVIVEVFLHQPYDCIQDVIRSITKKTERLVVINSHFHKDGYHVFVHNYDRLFREVGYDIVSSHIEHRQRYMVVGKI